MALGIVSLSTYHKKEIVPAATVTAADEGVSLEGTTVVLGQSATAVGLAGQLTRDAIIPTPTLATLSIAQSAGNLETVLKAGEISITDNGSNMPSLILNPSGPGQPDSGRLDNILGTMEFTNSGNVPVLQCDLTTGDTRIEGTYRSGDTVQFAGGPGLWKLGKGYNTPPISLEPNQHVEVEIDGVLYWLAVVSPIA